MSTTRIARLLRSRLALAAIFLVWCAFTLFTIAHHEAWRDEADSWLMARDRTLPEIWRIMRYAGTPMLLYVVEKPLAMLGVPYSLQWLANWPFAAGAVALVLFRRALWLPSRIAIVFSYAFVYEYAVVVRGYAMTTFFILLVCTLDAKRRAGNVNFAIGAALFCAANATAFGLLFACAYAAVAGVELLVVREERTLRALAAQAVGWLGILVSLAQLFPQPKDGQLPQTPSLALFGRAFAGGGLPVIQAGPEVRTAAAIVLVATTVWLVRKSKRALAVYTLFALALSFLFYAKYVGYVRHWSFYVVAAIAARVMACSEDDAGELAMLRASKANVAAWVLATGLLGAWCVEGVRMSVADDRGLFTNAKAMAQYLVDAHLERRDICGHAPTSAEAVLPYLTTRTTFFYPALSQDGSNMSWDRTLAVNNRMHLPELIARIRAHNPDWADPDRGPLLLWSLPISDDELKRWSLRLIHAEHQMVMSSHGESYWLYGPAGGAAPAETAP